LATRSRTPVLKRRFRPPASPPTTKCATRTSRAGFPRVRDLPDVDAQVHQGQRQGRRRQGRGRPHHQGHHQVSHVRPRVPRYRTSMTPASPSRVLRPAPSSTAVTSDHLRSTLENGSLVVGNKIAIELAVEAHKRSNRSAELKRRDYVPAFARYDGLWQKTRRARRQVHDRSIGRLSLDHLGLVVCLRRVVNTATTSSLAAANRDDPER